MAAMEETCPICSGPRHVANLEELARLHAVNAQMLDALKGLHDHAKAYQIFSDDIGSAVQDVVLAALAAAEPETRREGEGE